MKKKIIIPELSLVITCLEKRDVTISIDERCSGITYEVEKDVVVGEGVKRKTCHFISEG